MFQSKAVRTVATLAASLVLLASCGGGDVRVTSDEGATTRAETAAAPTPCGMELPDTLPDGKPTSTTAAIPVVTAALTDEAAALRIIRVDTDVAKAIEGNARLVWAQPWTIENDVRRGVLLQYEFDRPVKLPTNYGIPLRGKPGSESGDQYGADGLPLVAPPSAPEQYEVALSATIAVDLVEDRVHYLRASDEHFYC